MSPEPSVALVHDYLLAMRGAERTFASIAECFPDAPIFTTLYDEDVVGDRFAGREITTSYLQRLGAKQRGFRRLLPLFPRAVEKLPVQGFDIVISSSSAFAHGVRPSPGARHVSYCHSPFRYVWHERARAQSELPRIVRAPIGKTLDRIQRWDLDASKRVSEYIANSQITRQRIRRFYNRDSALIHPPVDVARFGSPQDPDEYFLYVGEIVGHKQVEVAIKACLQAGARLIAVGGGPEKDRLRAKYPDNVTFTGRVTDRELDELLSRCRALIVPNVEEFGIAAVEAQAAGRPVIARRAGGTEETVVPGVTGLLLPGGEVSDFAEAIRAFDSKQFDPIAISDHAQRFSVERFAAELTEMVMTR